MKLIDVGEDRRAIRAGVRLDDLLRAEVIHHVGRHFDGLIEREHAGDAIEAEELADVLIAGRALDDDGLGADRLLNGSLNDVGGGFGVCRGNLF